MITELSLLPLMSWRWPKRIKSIFPALGLFKNEEFVKFDGDLTQEIAVLRWLTSEETLDIPDKIEEVNEIMLSKRIKSEDSMFVFFYEDDDIFAKRLLTFMEKWTMFWTREILLSSRSVMMALTRTTL